MPQFPQSISCFVSSSLPSKDASPGSDSGVEWRGYLPFPITYRWSRCGVTPGWCITWLHNSSLCEVWSKASHTSVKVASGRLGSWPFPVFFFFFWCQQKPEKTLHSIKTNWPCLSACSESFTGLRLNLKSYSPLLQESSMNKYLILLACCQQVPSWCSTYTYTCVHVMPVE